MPAPPRSPSSGAPAARRGAARPRGAGPGRPALRATLAGPGWEPRQIGHAEHRRAVQPDRWPALQRTVEAELSLLVVLDCVWVLRTVPEQVGEHRNAWNGQPCKRRPAPIPVRA